MITVAASSGARSRSWRSTLYAGLTQVPQELVEAAADATAPTAWQAFRDVTVPLMKPIFVILIEPLDHLGLPGRSTRSGSCSTASRGPTTT